LTWKQKKLFAEVFDDYLVLIDPNETNEKEKQRTRAANRFNIEQDDNI
jgi:hypothetical protein